MSDTIFSIGHSNVPLDRMVEKLKENKIECVVDVRTYGFSKHNPQFNRPNLAKELPNEGIEYNYKGDNLGGKGRNVDYDLTIFQIVERIRKGERIAIMCSEGKPEQCHRKSMLLPSFKKFDVEMEHILYDKQSGVRSFASSQLGLML